MSCWKGVQRLNCGNRLPPVKEFSSSFQQEKIYHTSYPFGLHNERIIPWDYHSINDAFYIQAKACQKPQKKTGVACDNCRALTSTTLYEGIMNRIEHGVHESTPLVYHGVGGLVTAVRRLELAGHYYVWHIRVLANVDNGDRVSSRHRCWVP